MTKGDSKGPKFRRRAEARPDEVLDAALALFVEKGFAATRVEDIAKRAGLSKGAIYLYFSSKEALLEGLVRRALVPVAEVAGQTLMSAEGDPLELLKTVAKLIATNLADPSTVAVPKIVMREIGAFPELAQMYKREVIDRVLPLLIGLIRHGVEIGQFRPLDPEFTARSIVGPLVMHFLMSDLFGISSRNGLQLDRFLEHHLDILFNGILAPEGAENE